MSMYDLTEKEQQAMEQVRQTLSLVCKDTGWYLLSWLQDQVQTLYPRMSLSVIVKALNNLGWGSGVFYPVKGVFPTYRLHYRTKERAKRGTRGCQVYHYIRWNEQVE